MGEEVERRRADRYLEEIQSLEQDIRILKEENIKVLAEGIRIGREEVLKELEKWRNENTYPSGDIGSGELGEFIDSLLAGKERDDSTREIECRDSRPPSGVHECNVSPETGKDSECGSYDCPKGDCMYAHENSKDEIDKAIPITVERVRKEAISDFAKRVEVDYLYKCLGIKNPKMSRGWMKLKKEFSVE